MTSVDIGEPRAPRAGVARYMRIAVSIISILFLLSIPFWLRPFGVEGDSMEPTLAQGDAIIVDTLSIKFIPPRRGELLVFRNPHKYTDGDAIQVDVKRVIGLPGETVRVLYDRVIIGRPCENESGCQETYSATSTVIGGGMSPARGNGKNFDMYLGPLDYFVLGDNRQESADSRQFGAVQPENFVGRAVARVSPISRFAVFPLASKPAFTDGVQ